MSHRSFIKWIFLGQFPNLAEPNQRKQLIKMIQIILEDPEITVEIAQACCDRAVNVLNLENQLHKKNTPKDHP